MKKKNKFLTFILVICFVIPCMFMLVACHNVKENIATPYRATVNQINSDEEFAKTTFNQIIANTISKDTTINYDDGTVYTYNNTNKYIYWTTDSTEYLYIYDTNSDLMYGAHYTSTDVINNYGNILIIDTTIAGEYDFEFDIKNHLRTIFDVVKIQAIESKDYYTLRVTYDDVPFDIDYKIKNGLITEIYINYGDEEETITLTYPTNMDNLTFESEPFSSLNRLIIDSDFINDLSLIDFTKLSNIEIIEIDRSMTVPENIMNNFEFSEYYGDIAIYTKK